MFIITSYIIFHNFFSMFLRVLINFHLIDILYRIFFNISRYTHKIELSIYL